MKARWIETAADVDPGWLEGVTNLGITAGASAPEILVQELLERFRDRMDGVERLTVSLEALLFPLPRALQD